MTHFIHLSRKQFRAVVSKELNFFNCVHNPAYSINDDFYIIENLEGYKFTARRVRKVKVTGILTSLDFFELQTQCIFLLDPYL